MLPPVKLRVNTAEGVEVEVDFPDYAGIALWYAEMVASNKVSACLWTRLAAERFIRMVEQAESGKAPYFWSPMDVVDVCSFEERMPHVEAFEGLLELQPWQIFGNAGIWGLRRKDTGARLVRYASEWVPRKHGKSLRSATRLHYCMTCEGEVGPTGYIGAATENQANRVFAPARALVDKCENFADAFAVKTTSKFIRYETNGGLVEKLTSIGENQDGYNPHIVVMEELHAQKYDVYQVMRSAFGARKNPLFMTISTAGRRAGGLGYDVWKFMQRVLKAQQNNADHIFALMYTIDENDRDRLTDMDVVAKANPNLGVSVDPAIVIEYKAEAQGSPSERREFERTRFNIWSRAAGNLIDIEKWDACKNEHIRLDRFKGRKAWIGADLASRNDLAAVSILFEYKGVLVVFTRYYICEEAPAFELEEYSAMYQEWVDDGWLTVTPGGYIDFDVIQADIEAMAEDFDVESIGFDDYQANQTVGSLEKKNLPAVTVRKNAKTYTEPTDELLARINSKKPLIVHDGNPITAWCAGNVVGHYDELGQVLPKKDKTQPHEKIDGFDSLLIANIVRMAGKEVKDNSSVYNKRGVRGVKETA